MAFRSLNVFYPENDKTYKEFAELIKKENIKKLLEENKINVHSMMRDDISKFIAHLSDFSMTPLATFNELTEETLHKIVKLCNASGGVHKGGNVNYKHKYEKYKAKCRILKRGY